MSNLGTVQHARMRRRKWFVEKDMFICLITTSTSCVEQSSFLVFQIPKKYVRTFGDRRIETNEPSSETANGAECRVGRVFSPSAMLERTYYILYEWTDRKNINNRWCVKNMRLIFGTREFGYTLWHYYLWLDLSCTELIDLRQIIPNNNK